MVNCGHFYVRFFYFKTLRRCRIIKELQINEEIREKEVRLIDVDGSQMGVVPMNRAFEVANERRLDLVNISPTAKPPVDRKSVV